MRRHDILICAALLLATLAVYSQVRSFEFVNYDDREYISANPRIQAGGTWDSVAWAFTSYYGGNWFPLTWLSHMIDCRLFGLDSGWHHLTNVWIHALATLLLFTLLRHITGARWRSAFVAFLFALHPLHVESVAWVTERKDVLSGFFWILTLWMYVRYVERPRIVRYALLLLSFSFGLMSKSMVVTLPLVLLLLDFWPLRRIPWKLVPAPAAPAKKGRAEADVKPGLASILLEKAPLAALSACVAAATFLAQRQGGAVVSLDYIPLGTRLANGLLSYGAYLAEMVWPARLAAFYPQPAELPAWQILAAAVALTGLTIVVLRSVARMPYLAVGWLWYLITLAPVIGLVQVGMQSHADRYTYLPSIGIFIMLAWGVPERLARWPGAKRLSAGLAAAACAACLILTWRQVSYWRDSASLFRHALAVTQNNYVAHNGLGIALQEQGQIEEAISHYQEAIRLKPRYPEAYANYGSALLRLGRIDQAIETLSEAIRLYPGALEARINLGIAYHNQGKVEASTAQLLEALEIQPDSVNAHYNLGRVYAGAGRPADAMLQFGAAVKLQPENAEAHYNLGVTLAGQNQMKEAILEFTRALQINPDYAAAHNNLGSVLANMGQIEEAITHFREALRLKPDSEEVRYNLEYALSLRK